MGGAVKFAYADPPYPGMAHRYKADPNAQEVNHAVLIGHLCEHYPDGWALSTHVPGLFVILPLRPPKTRVAAWVKPYSCNRPGINPAYGWEPVVFFGGRRGFDNPKMVKDFHIESTLRGVGSGRKSILGQKPSQFNLWILDLLGFQRGDTLDDLFPGTGGMAYAVRAREEIGA